MSEQRCDLTELLVAECACPQHRGGVVVHPDAVETTGPVFEAQYAGVCSACTRPIRQGRMIRRAVDGGYVHDPQCPV